MYGLRAVGKHQQDQRSAGMDSFHGHWTAARHFGSTGGNFTNGWGKTLHCGESLVKSTLELARVEDNLSRQQSASGLLRSVSVQSP